MSEPTGPLSGRKLGDRRVRVDRPHAAYFRWSGHGQLTARAAASVPTTASGRWWAAVKALFLGRPLASEEELGERLSKRKALAIFSSDAISSSAYATEEILRVLVLGGAAFLAFGLEISIAIAVLLGIVAFSYRQVCLAYPTGGGSYSVSKANFGRTASLVAASALLIDYVLTVAVSTSSAVEQITSALPVLVPESVLIGLLAIALITVGNLRGIREAGNIFAVPTYLFVGSALLMIGIGTVRIVVFGEGGDFPRELADQTIETTQTAVALLLLRAFAAGAVALTGTEAIATGVPAFKPPEAKNAATTLAVMAVLLGVLFVGITFLAVNYGALNVGGENSQTVIAQVARSVYGDDTLPFFLFQGFTALLLVLAANTSFNAFPRLLAILAQDGFAPRQFSFSGRPAGVLVRDRHARRGRGGPRRVLRGRDAPADPALRSRRLHRLHDQPVRDDPALAARAPGRVPGTARDQCGRGGPDRGCRDRGGRGEGTHVAHRAAPHGSAVPRDVVHPPPVRPAGGRARGSRRRRLRPAAARTAGGHPGERDQPRGRPGDRPSRGRSPPTCARST